MVGNLAQYLYNREIHGRHRRHNRNYAAEGIAADRAADPEKNEPCKLPGVPRSTFLMDFSPDGKQVASTHGDHSVIITDLATGAVVASLIGHPRTPWCLAYHPTSNDIVASGCLAGQIRIWDINAKCSETWQSPTATVIASLTFHPSNRLLVFATGNTIYFWDWSVAEPFAFCQTGTKYERTRWVRFDHLGHYLFTGINTSTVVPVESVPARPPTRHGHTVDHTSNSRRRMRDFHREYRNIQREYSHLLNDTNTSSDARVPSPSEALRYHETRRFGGSTGHRRRPGVSWLSNRSSDNSESDDSDAFWPGSRLTRNLRDVRRFGRYRDANRRNRDNDDSLEAPTNTQNIERFFVRQPRLSQPHEDVTNPTVSTERWERTAADDTVTIERLFQRHHPNYMSVTPGETERPNRASAIPGNETGSAFFNFQNMDTEPDPQPLVSIDNLDNSFFDSTPPVDDPPSYISLFPPTTENDESSFSTEAEHNRLFTLADADNRGFSSVGSNRGFTLSRSVNRNFSLDSSNSRGLGDDNCSSNPNRFSLVNSNNPAFSLGNAENHEFSLVDSSSTRVFVLDNSNIAHQDPSILIDTFNLNQSNEQPDIPSPVYPNLDQTSPTNDQISVEDENISIVGNPSLSNEDNGSNITNMTLINDSVNDGINDDILTSIDSLSHPSDSITETVDTNSVSDDNADNTTSDLHQYSDNIGIADLQNYSTIPDLQHYSDNLNPTDISFEHTINFIPEPSYASLPVERDYISEIDRSPVEHRILTLENINVPHSDADMEHYSNSARYRNIFSNRNDFVSLNSNNTNSSIMDRDVDRNVDKNVAADINADMNADRNSDIDAARNAARNADMNADRNADINVDMNADRNADRNVYRNFVTVAEIHNCDNVADSLNNPRTVDNSLNSAQSNDEIATTNNTHEDGNNGIVLTFESFETLPKSTSNETVISSENVESERMSVNESHTAEGNCVVETDIVCDNNERGIENPHTSENNVANVQVVTSKNNDENSTEISIEAATNEDFPTNQQTVNSIVQNDNTTTNESHVTNMISTTTNENTSLRHVTNPKIRETNEIISTSHLTNSHIVTTNETQSTNQVTNENLGTNEMTTPVFSTNIETMSTNSANLESTSLSTTNSSNDATNSNSHVLTNTSSNNTNSDLNFETTNSNSRTTNENTPNSLPTNENTSNSLPTNENPQNFVPTNENSNSQMNEIAESLVNVRLELLEAQQELLDRQRERLTDTSVQPRSTASNLPASVSLPADVPSPNIDRLYHRAREYQSHFHRFEPETNPVRDRADRLQRRQRFRAFGRHRTLDSTGFPPGSISPPPRVSRSRSPPTYSSRVNRQFDRHRVTRRAFRHILPSTRDLMSSYSRDSANFGLSPRADRHDLRRRSSRERSLRRISSDLDRRLEIVSDASAFHAVNRNSRDMEITDSRHGTTDSRNSITDLRHGNAPQTNLSRSNISQTNVSATRDNIFRNNGVLDDITSLREANQSSTPISNVSNTSQGENTTTHTNNPEINPENNNIVPNSGASTDRSDSRISNSAADRSNSRNESRLCPITGMNTNSDHEYSSSRSTPNEPGTFLDSITQAIESMNRGDHRMMRIADSLDSTANSNVPPTSLRRFRQNNFRNRRNAGINNNTEPNIRASSFPPNSNSSSHTPQVTTGPRSLQTLSQINMENNARFNLNLRQSSLSHGQEPYDPFEMEDEPVEDLTFSEIYRRYLNERNSAETDVRNNRREISRSQRNIEAIRSLNRRENDPTRSAFHADSQGTLDSSTRPSLGTTINRILDSTNATNELETNERTIHVRPNSRNQLDDDERTFALERLNTRNQLDNNERTINLDRTERTFNLDRSNTRTELGDDEQTFNINDPLFGQRINARRFLQQDREFGDASPNTRRRLLAERRRQVINDRRQVINDRVSRVQRYLYEDREMNRSEGRGTGESSRLRSTFRERSRESRRAIPDRHDPTLMQTDDYDPARLRRLFLDTDREVVEGNQATDNAGNRSRDLERTRLRDLEGSTREVIERNRLRDAEHLESERLRDAERIRESQEPTTSNRTGETRTQRDSNATTPDIESQPQDARQTNFRNIANMTEQCRQNLSIGNQRLLEVLDRLPQNLQTARPAETTPPNTQPIRRFFQPTNQQQSGSNSSNGTAESEHTTTPVGGQLAQASEVEQMNNTSLSEHEHQITTLQQESESDHTISTDVHLSATDRSTPTIIPQINDTPADIPTDPRTSDRLSHRTMMLAELESSPDQSQAQETLASNPERDSLSQQIETSADRSPQSEELRRSSDILLETARRITTSDEVQRSSDIFVERLRENLRDSAVEQSPVETSERLSATVRLANSRLPQRGSETSSSERLPISESSLERLARASDRVVSTERPYERSSERSTDLASTRLERSSDRSSDLASTRLERSSERSSDLASTRLERSSERPSDLASARLERSSERSSDLSSSRLDRSSERSSDLSTARLEMSSERLRLSDLYERSSERSSDRPERSSASNRSSQRPSETAPERTARHVSRSLRQFIDRQYGADTSTSRSEMEQTSRFHRYPPQRRRHPAMFSSQDEHAEIENMASHIAREINMLSQHMNSLDEISQQADNTPIDTLMGNARAALRRSERALYSSERLRQRILRYPEMLRDSVPRITITRAADRPTANMGDPASSSRGIDNLDEPVPLPRPSRPEPDPPIIPAQYLHPHYADSILEEGINRPTDALQFAINRTIAGAFIGAGETAVASNINNLTHRIQMWDFTQYNIPDLTLVNENVVVPHCKLHNDASVEISRDSTLLATFVPSHRGFPDSTILAVFSLRPESLGHCLYTHSFGPNAVSVSISPTNSHVVVGLASRRITWVYAINQMVAQIYKLTEPMAGEFSMKHISNMHHPYESTLRTPVSLNSIRWIPQVGHGLVYATNRGTLNICKPGSLIITRKAHKFDDDDVDENYDVGELSSFLSTHRLRRTAGTQTDSPAQRFNNPYLSDLLLDV